MNLLEVGVYTVAYVRTGNDRNGNPVYLINIFKDINNNGIKKYYSVNYRSTHKLDKYGSIRAVSYNIDDTLKMILSDME